MNYPTITFLDLMKSAALASGKVLGTDLATSEQQAILAARLQRAARWLWDWFVPWPHLVTGGTVSVTSGVVAWSSLLNGTRYYSLWESDPRTVFDFDAPSSVEETRVKSRESPAGLLVDTAESSIFAFYLRRKPHFTATTVSAGGSTSIAANGVVWWTTGGVGTPTHDCYLNISGSAQNDSSANLTDATKFERQYIPMDFEEIIVQRGEELRLIGQREADDARAPRILSVEMAEELGIAAMRMKQAPWHVNDSPTGGAACG